MKTRSARKIVSAGGVVAVLVAGTFGLSGCASAPAPAAPDGPAHVVLAPVKGSDLKTVTLSEAAIGRLGLVTASVQAGAAQAKGHLMVPYSALIYDDQGQTWTFVKAGVRTFVRAAVTVESITNSSVLLSQGPAVGTTVVTTGGQELLGAEYEVSGE